MLIGYCQYKGKTTYTRENMKQKNAATPIPGIIMDICILEKKRGKE